MTSVDYHEQCGSYVRIRSRDLQGPFQHVLEELEHHASAVYPGVKVGVCHLAAGHPDDLCEMFVDSTGWQPDEQPVSHWITWANHGRHGEMASTYEWVTSPNCCPTESPNGWVCTRSKDHTGGHVFTCVIA